MTRVSLKEAYDNKDVVAQIYAIRDTAESAVDTSEQAVTTANTASDHVDALVPQVEQAVENANQASASAQASAQTVTGYENRLGTVETGLSTAQHDITAVEDNVEDLSGDLNAVTLRVTTAEGQIVTIQGRVTALETADGQNIKINRVNDYAVGLTGNQPDIYGNKGFKGVIDSLNGFIGSALKWSLIYTRTNPNNNQWLIGFTASSVFIASIGSTRASVHVMNGTSGRTYPQPIIKVCKKEDGTEDVWMYADYGAWCGWDIIKNWIGYTTTDKYNGVSVSNQITQQNDAPAVGDTYISIIDSIDFNNEH